MASEEFMFEKLASLVLKFFRHLQKRIPQLGENENKDTKGNRDRQRKRPIRKCALTGGKLFWQRLVY